MLGRMIICGAALTLALSGAASGAEVEVKLLNKGADGAMVFEPSFVKINPGDSVKFVAADKGHNAQTIDGMAPDGAQPFKGPFSKDFTQAFDKEGVYGVKCNPHYVMGMVGLIAVGSNYPNLDAAKNAQTNPASKKRLDADFAKLGQ